MNTVTSTDIIDALVLLRPYDIDIPKIRYGSAGDGGYVFANAMLPSQPVLSFGVSNNCDLEFDFAERGHKVVMFDPSVEGPPKQHRNFTFHKIGLAGKSDPAAGYVSLSTALDMAGYVGRSDVILKCDIEGAEFAAIADAPQEILLQFEQIALEAHWLNKLISPIFREEYSRCFQKINSFYTLFHVHANNCTPLMVIGGSKYNNNHVVGGAVVAQVVELSYIRSNKVRRSPSRTVYPTLLDQPNHPKYPDHLLTFFPFLPCSDDALEQMRLIAKLNDMRSR